MGIPLGIPSPSMWRVRPQNDSNDPTSNVPTTLESVLTRNYVHPDVVDAFIAEVGKIDKKGDEDGQLDLGGELATAFTFILPDSEFSKKYGDGVLAVRSVLTRLFSQKDDEKRKDSILISEPETSILSNINEINAYWKDSTSASFGGGVFGFRR